MSDQDTKNRLADWFRQWGAPLRKFIQGRRAIPASDLDDVAQEVFLRLLRYDRVELVENPQAYLYKMASNVTAEWGIRSRQVKPHDSQWLTDLTSAEDPVRSFSRSQLEEEVRRAIESLAPRQKKMLKMHHFEGLGYAEIAQAFSATPRSVKRALTKSYYKLRLELDAQLLGEVTDGRE
jgi:RNA polymerase sigma-70 factor (ECF subfamily)